MARLKSVDPWTYVVIVLSFGLFALALFVEGFAHDLLLEAGVFLVSIKLILMARNNAEIEQRNETRLIQIEDMPMQQNTSATPQLARRAHWPSR
jgi:hypothetical protein